MIEKDKMMTHIKSHVNYPTTKLALVEACNNMMEIPEEDKKWFAETLPDSAYDTPEDVLKALGM